ncbi:MAG: sulfurtransferase [Gammaproteobacteria bacterium]|nr:sulfurtransferase [Gammaproteobacteria bacterium]
MAYRTLVEPEQLAAHLDDPSWVTVDCRFDLHEPDSGGYAYGARHIPGARYAHLDNDLSGRRRATTGRHPLPDPGALSETLGRWGIDNATQVVVYDDVKGAIAARLWWLLRWLGHEPVAVLNGGLTAWLRAGLPMTDELPRVHAMRFEPHPDDARWVDTRFIEERLGADVCRLIDARSAVRFRGEQEPFDPVAGHIPGALNRPLDRNFGPDGKFLPAAQLRAEFQELARGKGTADMIHMCGSGVTACHNLLAMEVAGLGEGRLYVDSWSGWITHRTRPVATGE